VADKEDTPRRLNKANGSALVFLGSFNPAIFQPAWFMRHDLIPDEEDGAEVEVVSQQITSFGTDWLRVIVQPEKCELHASDEAPSFKALHDLAVGIFALLPHTPVTAFGINRSVHFQMESEEAYTGLGFKLFNTEPWDGVLSDTRMRTLQVEDRPDGPEGNVVMSVTVQPSAVFKRSIFVATNDHYSIDPDAADSVGAMDKLDEVFDASLQHSDQLIERVRSL
jgi:hypothetical protein